MLHNESVNVWTHFLGAVIFIYFIINSYFQLAPPGIYTKLSGLVSDPWSSSEWFAFNRTSILVANIVQYNTKNNINNETIIGDNTTDENRNQENSDIFENQMQ